LISNGYLSALADVATILKPIHSVGTGSIQVAFMLGRLSIGDPDRHVRQDAMQRDGFLCKAATPTGEALIRVGDIVDCIPGEGSLNLGNNL
jgi:hypothetical protein